jgi:hypothetical protein
MCDRIILYKYFSQNSENSPQKKNLNQSTDLQVQAPLQA